MTPDSMADAVDEKEPLALTGRILDWLDLEKEVRPASIDQKAWDYAVRYTKGRYQVGLGHYRQLFHSLGWSGRRHGLDVGSGAGHWSIAFALDNARATGVDKHAQFVVLANGASTQVGLADRVQHQLGNAEKLDFPDCHFDAAWAHSVLQYCDIEDSVSEIARVLEPKGQFYCGYSSIGFRFDAIYNSIMHEQRNALKVQLGIYLAANLRRDGIAHPPWSALNCATAEELIEICAAFGLRFLLRPGLQDGRPDFAGVPGTIDLLCERDDEPGAVRSQLCELSPANEVGRRRYRRLLRSGLGKLVHDVLRERRDDLDDPETRSVYVLAGVRAGRAQQVAGLAERGVDPLVRGLLAFDRRQYAKAIEPFRALPPDHPDRSFLLGAALLRAGDAVGAVREFEAGAAAKRRPIDCEFGAMLARIDAADWREQRERMARAVSGLPEVFGASAGEIARLLQTISRIQAGD